MPGFGPPSSLQVLTAALPYLIYALKHPNHPLPFYARVSNTPSNRLGTSLSYVASFLDWFGLRLLLLIYCKSATGRQAL